MSTVGTQLNWGASYVINDFYRRFLVRKAGERHYVFASQMATLLLMVFSLIVTFCLGSIEFAWKLLMVTGAGTGTVLLLRWFWWRINAWSEVAAMIAAAGISLFLQLGWPKWSSDDPQQFAYIMLTTVGATTIVWVVVTFLTPPEPRAKLIEFYRRVRPAGPGWQCIAVAAGDVQPSESLGSQFANWLLGCVLVYATLFGIGKLIFKQWAAGAAFMVAAAIAAALISRSLSQADWVETKEQT